MVTIETFAERQQQSQKNWQTRKSRARGLRAQGACFLFAAVCLDRTLRQCIIVSRLPTNSMPFTLNGLTLYRISEALRIAAISRPTFFRWVEAGRIPDAQHRDRNNRRLFTKEEVAAIKRVASALLSHEPPFLPPRPHRAAKNEARFEGGPPRRGMEGTALAGDEDRVSLKAGLPVVIEGNHPPDLRWRLFHGDAANALGTVADESVNCVVTSPPYFWQRDYGVDGQIGHEPSIDGYVAALVSVFSQIRRVLRPDGVAFLNLGDTYYSAKGKPHGRDKKSRGRTWSRVRLRAVDGPGLGLPRKSLIGIPWRTALALQDDGWTLRADVLWKRPGALPEPTARDRPWLTHEHVFILTKGPKYWFDRAPLAGQEDIWSIPARPDMPGSHFAPFPLALAERCIRCGTPPGGVVLDPFAGSGTSLAAALRLGRSAIGVELKKEYCDFIVGRLHSSALKPTPLFVAAGR